MSTILKITGYDDPSLEGGKTTRQKGDPSENEIWGYRNVKGEFVPGLTHGIRTQGFMAIAKNPPEELAAMTPEERAECAMAESDRLFHPAFHPAWTPELFDVRRLHVPGEHRQFRAGDEGVSMQEYAESDILAGMN